MLTLLELTRDYPYLYYLVAFLSVYIAYYVCYVVKVRRDFVISINRLLDLDMSQ